MTSLLVTFPGRAGDLLWALPTVRALSRRLGQPIDLLISGEFAGLVPLLEQQPYLSRVVADPNWGMSQGWQPPNREDVISPYVSTLHLGYRRWPELGLAQETLETYNHQILNASPTQHYLEEWELDLQTPWITLPPHATREPGQLTAGFAETHCELKAGLLFALGNTTHNWINWLVMRGGRYEQEWLGPCAVDYSLHVYPMNWTDAAWHIGTSAVFLGDCSGLHVLAVACGTPVVLYEPMEARWNPIFYPLGWDGPQVTRVVGLDGTWTTDARHTAETIERVVGRKDR